MLEPLKQFEFVFLSFGLRLPVVIRSREHHARLLVLIPVSALPILIGHHALFELRLAPINDLRNIVRVLIVEHYLLVEVA